MGKKEMTEMVYTGLGFPVILVGFGTKTVRGVQVPNVNLNRLQKVAFEGLIVKLARYSGSEIAFIRAYMGYTQVEFARLLNLANHSIVSIWEKKGHKATGMDFNTETLLRLTMARTVRKGLVNEVLESCSSVARIAETPDPVRLSAA
jgi:DNA-binding transcriptional regulator YiaG